MGKPDHIVKVLPAGMTLQCPKCSIAIRLTRAQTVEVAREDPLDVGMACAPCNRPLVPHS